METAYVMINCEMGSENNIVERIRPIGCVKEVSGVFGNYDVIVKIQSRHIDEIRKTIVEDIRKLERIRCTTTLMCSK
ncbi:MAG: Lrp/AsnC family transcriptional regulator [Thaumarchaeota archaeon]|nr:Lrp/AsnC family transcriptional regulator [Nitrososphaerota archaeon]